MILFICGGAFDGLDKIIEKRTDKFSVGFGADVKSKKAKAAENLLKKAEPYDLVKYGLIPELVGRLPVIVSLDQLDEDAFVSYSDRAAQLPAQAVPDTVPAWTGSNWT